MTFVIRSRVTPLILKAVKVEFPQVVLPIALPPLAGYCEILGAAYQPVVCRGQSTQLLGRFHLLPVSLVYSNGPFLLPTGLHPGSWLRTKFVVLSYSVQEKMF